jgi:hypothetical protein
MGRDETANIAQDESQAQRVPARRPSRSILPWVLGIGGAMLVLFVLCGGTVGVVLYYTFRGNDADAVQLGMAGAPGANLPRGAPPRAIRVTEFNGVFQVKGQLTQGDVVFQQKKGNFNNKRCKEYVIDLEAGRTYVIDLESKAFDAFLWLEDLDGLLIDQNDDAPGEGLNSRITFTPMRSAPYVVVATSLSGGVGAFTLTIRDSNHPRPR